MASVLLSNYQFRIEESRRFDGVSKQFIVNNLLNEKLRIIDCNLDIRSEILFQRLQEEVTKTFDNVRRIKPFIIMCENQDSS